jgi:beta-glucosidase-like glycosyl hydrolase
MTPRPRSRTALDWTATAAAVALTLSLPALAAQTDPAARAQALLARMTLDEKASQLQPAAPAIARLGIPAHNWWSEGLHGVARPDGGSDLYRGLTVWSPNVNIFRDPRWGRGQETYGEHPYLTSRLGVAHIRGLQGPDPGAPKVSATVKHFADIHSEGAHRYVDTPERAVAAAIRTGTDLMCEFGDRPPQPAVVLTRFIPARRRPRRTSPAGAAPACRSWSPPGTAPA